MTKKPDPREKHRTKSARPAERPGEGNREADRRYREDATRFAESGKVDEAARRAEKAVQGKEAPKLRKTEEKGRAPARKP
jgi:hypothetical protein